MNWILLRGLTREARHWAGFAEQLTRALPGSASAATRVMALDLPGNGAFCRDSSPAAVDAMADFAREQLHARGLAPPYSLVAMSLGGMVAADWALRYPMEIERLVLINTSIGRWAASVNACAPAPGCHWRSRPCAGVMQAMQNA